MAMRIDITFQHPLDREQRIRCLLAIADLAKSRALRWSAGGHAAVVTGEAMGRERVAEALAAAEVPVAKIESSLTADENASADEALAEQSSGQERLRPIGR